MTNLVKWASVIVAIGGMLASVKFPHPYDQLLMAIVAGAAAILKSPNQ